MVKVSIIGSTGIIGKNVAFTLAREDTVDEIVMFSRPKSVDKAKGETYDMYDALAARDIDCRLTPSCDFNDLTGSHIILIAAGIHREKGMKRLDLAIPNAEIVSYYSQKIAEYAPDSIILVATNPVDVMTTVALKTSGFKKSKVIGVGNHLDSLRLKN
ncbi:MAG: malate dehydrogenase, partial [Methanobrevibacter sp.]|nr:malate dehydrogenase [Methanobrevibacter sp.]